MYDDWLENTVKDRKLKKAEGKGYMDNKLWCKVCKRIMNDPTICKNRDCDAMVCRGCVKTLDE